METKGNLRAITEEIHSTVVATLDQDGRPVTRVIDMMLCGCGQYLFSNCCR